MFVYGTEVRIISHANVGVSFFFSKHDWRELYCSNNFRFEIIGCGYTADSRLFEPALGRTFRLFEPFFIPRGYSLTSSTKNSSVIRTFSCSNFRLFEPISEPP